MDLRMGLSAGDWQALLLSFKLAAISTMILVLIAVPLAWWLSFRPHPVKSTVGALITLPLILPPSVIGFYLLVALGPNGFIGELCQRLGITLLPFTFRGLVVTSLIYSLPFVLQPIQNTFMAIGATQLEVAATLGVPPSTAVWKVLLPQAKIGIISAAVLGFAHTVGEFGMILIIGGNIPGATQVAAVQIYNHVEAFEYQAAAHLSLVMLAFSFLVVLIMHLLNQKFNRLNHA